MSEDLEGAPVVLISNRQTTPVDEGRLAQLARECLEAEGRGSAELSVSFVTEDEMAQLHVRYAGEAGPTDVLSFSMCDGGEVLGDVVIAPSVAAANDSSDPAGELRLLLVHGILHLLGYDHQTDAARAEMWAKQERYTGVKVP